MINPYTDMHQDIYSQTFIQKFTYGRAMKGYIVAYMNAKIFIQTSNNEMTQQCISHK